MTNLFRTNKNISILSVVIILCFSLNFSLINCEEQGTKAIKFQKESFVNIPQISDEYSVVRQVGLGSDKKKRGQQLTPVNKKFIKEYSADFYVLKSVDQQYQKQKSNLLKGKNIFTSEYINDHFPIEIQHEVYEKVDLEHLNAQNNAQNKKVQNLQVVNKPKQQQKQQQIEQKSTQLYNEFKNIDIPKQSNLRSIENNNKLGQKQQNFRKLIMYIVVGLALSFVIIKKATKSQAKLPSVNQQKKQLRLKDTYLQEDDDQDASSSQSD